MCDLFIIDRIRLKNTELWNASEQAEAKNKRQDSARTAREYIVAIPHELMEKDKKEGVKCIVNFCDKLAQKFVNEHSEHCTNKHAVETLMLFNAKQAIIDKHSKQQRLF